MIGSESMDSEAVPRPEQGVGSMDLPWYRSSQITTVAVVNNPLHVWQVREACAHRKLPTRNVLVVVIKQPSVNVQALERVLEELGEWSSVVWLATPPALRSGLRGAWSILRRYRHCADWQRKLVAVRDPFIVMVPLNRLAFNRQVAVWLGGEELIWLDHGTMTPVLVRKDVIGVWRMSRAVGRKVRNQGGQTRRHKRGTNRRAYVGVSTRNMKRGVKGIPGVVWLRRRLKRLARRLGISGGLIRGVDKRLQRFCGLPPSTKPLVEVEPLAFKSRYPSAQTCFTVTEVWPLPPVRWTPNRLAWLRSRLENSPISEDELHFLGAPLVERDGVPFEDYRTWLKAIKQAHVDVSQIVYIPHPWESDAFLDQLTGEVDITVRRLGLPYEIAMATMETRPAVVASWFCTALEHLELMGLRDIRLEAYRIPSFSSTISRQRQARKTMIFTAADAFYRRHEGHGGIDVREVPGVEFHRWQFARG